VQVHPVGVFEQQADGEEAEARVPMLLLKDDAGREVHLPIGSCDGFAIHVALTQQSVLRPLTHDLGLNILARLSARLEHVVIDAYSARGCRATLSVASAERKWTIPARAGDGIALALRAELPIFMTEEVFEQARDGSGSF